MNSSVDIFSNVPLIMNLLFRRAILLYLDHHEKSLLRMQA